MNKLKMLEPNPLMPISMQNKKWLSTVNFFYSLPLRVLSEHIQLIFSEEGFIPSEKYLICLRTCATNYYILFLEGVWGMEEQWSRIGYQDSHDRTSRIGALFAEILEELIQFIVVCLCLSLSGTSFTDIPVYCWQLLLKIKLYFHYQADLSLISEDYSSRMCKLRLECGVLNYRTKLCSNYILSFWPSVFFSGGVI